MFQFLRVLPVFFFSLSAAVDLLAQQTQAQQPQTVQMASAHPALVWQRTSPKPGVLDGPVVYQLLFSASGTPNALARFDTNPRHLTNSLITDNGATVMIGGANGLLINGSSGIITFAPGQNLPLGQFLPLAGGTLSGDLNGKNATFSGNVTSTGGMFTGNGSGLSNVNAAQLGGQLPTFYQQRVGGNCSPGTSVVAVNANGTVVCAAAILPRYFNSANLHTVLDTSSNTGTFTSITIGTDGLPIISYQGDSAGTLRLSVVHCTAADCSTHGAATVLDSPTAESFTSITIGTDGLPIISYEGVSAGKVNLSVVHCTAVDCSTRGAVTVLDSAGGTPSITIGTDGLPIISYLGAGNSNLSVVHCTAVDCSTHGAATVLDIAPLAGSSPSITIGTDGLPIISYAGLGSPNFNLSVVHCSAVDCSTHGTVTVLDSAAKAGQYASITIGTDGLPIISYQGFNGLYNLSVVHCTAVDCSTHGAVTVVDTSGEYTSITIGTDGLPVISYEGISSLTANLSVVHCTAADCSTHGAVSVLDSTSGAGFFSSITIGTDGLPIISYLGVSGGNTDLSVVHCANLSCAPPFVRRR